MSRCLCCGKLLRTETEHEWHASCIKSFFGTKKLPDIDVSKEVLHQIVIDSTNKGYTVPGVQKKMSLHLTADGEGAGGAVGTIQVCHAVTQHIPFATKLNDRRAVAHIVNAHIHMLPVDEVLGDIGHLVAGIQDPLAVVVDHTGVTDGAVIRRAPVLAEAGVQRPAVGDVGDGKGIAVSQFHKNSSHFFLPLYYRGVGIARVEDGGYGRFLKKAPQKLLDWVAGLWS